MHNVIVITKILLQNNPINLEVRKKKEKKEKGIKTLTMQIKSVSRKSIVETVISKTDGLR